MLKHVRDVTLVDIVDGLELVPLVDPEADGENRDDEQDNYCDHPDAALGAFLAAALSHRLELFDFVQCFLTGDTQPNVGLRRVWRGPSTL